MSSQKSSLNTRALEMITYINDHYQDITLQSLAKHFHYTQEYCSRLIKAAAGTSFTDILRKVRLNRAETFLLTSSYSIETISHIIGYEEPGTFIRLFKRIRDVSRQIPSGTGEDVKQKGAAANQFICGYRL